MESNPFAQAGPRAKDPSGNGMPPGPPPPSEAGDSTYYSTEDLAQLDMIEKTFKDHFSPGTIFDSKEALKEALKEVGDPLGVYMSAPSSRVYQCSRGGKTKAAGKDNEGAKSRSAVNALKCDCGFRCNYGFCIPTFADPESKHRTTRKETLRTTPELKQVKILPSSSWRHTNGCKPSYEQYHFQAKRGGGLFLKESEKMNDLLSILELCNWKMNNQTLRGHLKLVDPTRSYITAEQLRNFRLWAKKEHLERQQSDKPLVLTDADLNKMFDSVIAKPDSSIAVEQANKLYQDLLRDTMNEDNNSWKVEQYLSKLKQEDECFDYFIGRDNTTGAASIVLWQTGTMRADFELYGCALHVDFMKRRMNCYDWPYISLVVIDANGSPRVAAEGIACTERHDAYVAGVNALLKMSPGRTRDDVLVVFADGALNPDILGPENMNLPNANFVWDSYHLLNDVWPKYLGGNWCGMLSSSLSDMLNANSQEEFDTVLSKIEETYAGRSDILNKVHLIAEKKDHYAKFVLDTMEGTCGKRSNNPAEQNHASIVAHLGGALYESPTREIILLLTRQRDHETLRQQEKSRYSFEIPAEIAMSPELLANAELRRAKETLEKKSFELWKEQYHLSKCYCVTIHPTTADRSFVHHMYPTSRRDVPADERCNCAFRIQHLMQCHHEIAENDGKFCTNLIDRRHVFLPRLDTNVKRNSNIDGDDFSISEAAVETSVAEPMAVDPASSMPTFDTTAGLELEDSKPPSELFQTASSSRSRKRITFTDIRKVLDDFAAKAVANGMEVQAFGAAVQLQHCIQNNGNLVEGGLEDIIRSFQQTFSGTATGNVTFTLTEGSTSCPALPPPRPGSRQPEVRLKKSSEPIRGNKKGPSTCSFCKTPRCNIGSCARKNDFGIHLQDGKKRNTANEINLLSQYLRNAMTNMGVTYFPPWPEENKSALQQGVPREARHLVIRGLHTFSPPNCPSFVVAAVQFVAEGAIPLNRYEYVPMPYTELNSAIYNEFRAQGKCIFVAHNIYPAIQNVVGQEKREPGIV